MPLAIKQVAFNLVDQDIPTPAALDRLPNVPLSPLCIFYAVQNPDLVTPRQLCNNLLHKLLARVRFSKARIYFKFLALNPRISGNAEFTLEDLDQNPSADKFGPSLLNAWTHGDLLIVYLLGMTDPELSSMFQRSETAKRFAENQKADYGRDDARPLRMKSLNSPPATPGFLASGNDRVGHLATASKKLLQNFGATACEHAAVNFDPMVQLRVIQHLHH
jgi:hypothetical protein